MTYYIGNTDYQWYQYLKSIAPEDMNFWQPGGTMHFRAIEPGAPFLLKLKSPVNKVAGIGFFSSFSILPIGFAWEVFQNRNGAEDFQSLYSRINAYRGSANPLKENPNIGCIILTNPVFFKESDWIEAPSDWSRNIVQGKTYSTSDPVGQAYWQKVEEVLLRHAFVQEEEPGEEGASENRPAYNLYLGKVRIGQGAFRVLVTDAYARRCAISGEKTLPVLEAAHIKPYASFGINKTSNGLLLRADLHKLFDSGYVTVTESYDVEVSRRIKEEFENGRDYYKYHGQSLISLPHNPSDLPNRDYLGWHNENVFRV